MRTRWLLDLSTTPLETIVPYGRKDYVEIKQIITKRTIVFKGDIFGQ